MTVGFGICVVYIYYSFLLDITNMKHKSKMYMNCKLKPTPEVSISFYLPCENGMRLCYAILAFVFLHSQPEGNSRTLGLPSFTSIFNGCLLLLSISYLLEWSISMSMEKLPIFYVQDNPSWSLLDSLYDFVRWILWWFCLAILCLSLSELWTYEMGVLCGRVLFWKEQLRFFQQ